MSVVGLFSGNLYQGVVETNSQQQQQNEFQQLGQALQAGNLTQAQQDYATLAQNNPILAQPATAATETASTAQLSGKQPPSKCCRGHRSAGRYSKYRHRGHQYQHGDSDECDAGQRRSGRNERGGYQFRHAEHEPGRAACELNTAEHESDAAWH
jgi:hypothetical protein